MTYACEVSSFSAAQIQALTVALNDCIRRIFSYNRWESVRFLRTTMNYPSVPVTDIFNRRRELFLKNIPRTGNSTLLALSNLIQE